MKLGAENRNTVIIAVVLAVVALFMVWRTFFGGGSEVIASKPPAAVQTAAPAVGPAARRIRGGSRVPSTQTSPTLTASLDPRLRLDLLKGSEQTEYKGAGRNIFRAEAEIEIPKAVDNGLKKKADNIVPPPLPSVYTPPSPPAINIKFFGFANRPGEPRQVFLLQNDDVFIARENEVINRRYKVVKINNNSVEIEDLLANNKQTIQLTAG